MSSYNHAIQELRRAIFTEGDFTQTEKNTIINILATMDIIRNEYNARHATLAKEIDDLIIDIINNHKEEE